MKRRGFLASTVSLLTFSAFEKRCMAEAGVSSPTQIAAAPTEIWAIMDLFDDTVVAVSASKEMAERMAIIFNYDQLASGDDECIEFEEELCRVEGIDIEDEDEKKRQRKINRVVVKWCNRVGVAILPRKGDEEVRFSDNRPSFEVMKTVSEVRMCFEVVSPKESMCTDDEVVILTGNENVNRFGDPYKPTE